MKARQANEELRLRKQHHEVAGTATLSGAFVGATTGLWGGPPGAIAGGVIGGAIGAIIGTVMEMTNHDAFEHDADLDDIIGVTSRDLGAREEAVHGIDDMQRAERESEADLTRIADEDLALH